MKKVYTEIILDNHEIRFYLLSYLSFISKKLRLSLSLNDVIYVCHDIETTIHFMLSSYEKNLRKRKKK